MEINSFFLDLVPYLIPLLMIGVGTDLDIESFKNLITNSKSSIVGLLIQVTLLPIVGIVTSLFIDNQSVAIGIIVIMCAPGGHISSMYSSLMKGNVALTTSLTIVTQLIAFATIPFWLNVASIFNDKVGVQVQIDSTELLIEITKSGGHNFVDLGCHIGFFSVIANCYNNNVLAIDKNENFLSVLEETIEDNDLANLAIKNIIIDGNIKKEYFEKLFK